MKQRQLSEFLCREMLYDFAVGDLDASRTKAVEASIKEYPELETEFQSLKQGLKYSQTMSQVRMSSDFLKTIPLEGSILDKTIDLFKVYKWTAIIIGSIFIGTLLFGVFFFNIFEKIPQDILWTIDPVESSRDVKQQIENTTDVIKNDTLENMQKSNL